MPQTYARVDADKHGTYVSFTANGRDRDVEAVTQHFERFADGFRRHGVTRNRFLKAFLLARRRNPSLTAAEYCGTNKFSEAEPSVEDSASLAELLEAFVEARRHKPELTADEFLEMVFGDGEPTEPTPSPPGSPAAAYFCEQRNRPRARQGRDGRWYWPNMKRSA